MVELFVGEESPRGFELLQSVSDSLLKVQGDLHTLNEYNTEFGGDRTVDSAAEAYFEQSDPVMRDATDTVGRLGEVVDAKGVNGRTAVNHIGNIDEASVHLADFHH
ncbi:hypothetical protein [Kitasatospora sp. GAS204B]|uniref:hypothetical protein n=1 Tax=unclassified Kitasatospora TaxID=2633591 RepID=UPI0024767D9C|nr:hypothetical protein [Kitasatospora sp. GAS204B]MDH6116810.1 hypothetical protein [Kitasatospora sp. GAS204B]